MHRRLKCDGGEGSIHCEQLPEVENFAAVARALQLARGLDDADVRFFVGADQRESYDKVRTQLPRRQMGNMNPVQEHFTLKPLSSCPVASGWLCFL